MSVCLSVRLFAWNNSAPTGRIFMEFDISLFFKCVEKIQVSLKSDNNNGTLHEDLCTFMVISRLIFLRMRNVSDRSCTENKEHILYSITFFRKSCRLWDKVEKFGRAGQGTDDNIIRRMRFAGWIIIIIYLLQLGFHPVAVVLTLVHTIQMDI
jgi:hypothetical protein